MLWRRFLLTECLQAYSDLDPAEWDRLQALLITDKYKDTKAMTLTYYDRGKIQVKLEGKLEGELEALQRMALLLLEAKFGLLSATVKERVETLSTAQLEKLMVELVKAQSFKELGLEN